MSARFVAGLALAGLASLQGCSDARSQPALPTARQPELVIVLVDRSMSRTPTQMGSDRALLTGLIHTLDLGDRLILARVHAHGQSDDVTPWTSNAPTAVQPAAPTLVEKGALEQWRSAAATAAETVFDTTLARTDLLASFADDADYIKESKRPRTRIVVFSDMLQSTPGLDFERDGAPDASWIAREKEAGTLPMLRGACVVVVGAETRTARGAAVKAFWKGYFEAAGARLPEENYRYTATEAGGLGC